MRASPTQALQSADVILLLGARLNWILHFGKPPRFRADVKIIQVDISAEEMHTNVPAEVALVGDVTAVVGQLNEVLKHKPYRFGHATPWWTELRDKVEANRKNSEALYHDNELPMSYYRAFHEIRQLLPPDVIFVSEGANTMDIGRYGARPAWADRVCAAELMTWARQTRALGERCGGVARAQHGDRQQAAPQPLGRGHVWHHGRWPWLCHCGGPGAPEPARRLRRRRLGVWLQRHGA